MSDNKIYLAWDLQVSPALVQEEFTGSRMIVGKQASFILKLLN